MVTGQGRAGKGRTGQGRAGQGRAERDKICIGKPQTMAETRQGRQTADRQHTEHAHLSTSPHTPITFHCRGGQHQKAKMEREKNLEQDKDQDWQKIHVCATCNRMIQGNAAKSPSPNRRAAKGPSQRTPGQMPLALGWGASAGHTSPP